MGCRRSLELCTVTRVAIKRKITAALLVTGFLFCFTLVHLGIVEVHQSASVLHSDTSESSERNNLLSIFPSIFSDQILLVNPILGQRHQNNSFTSDQGSNKTRTNTNKLQASYNYESTSTSINGLKISHQQEASDSPTTTKGNIENTDAEDPSEGSSEEISASQEEVETADLSPKEVVIPDRAENKHPDDYQKDQIIQQVQWTSEMSEAIESELAERKAMIQEQCKSKTVITAPRQKKQIIFKNLLYVKDYNFVWCPIFKSASTTWVKNLLLLAGETKVDSGLHHRARQLYPLPQDTDALMLDQHTTKLMIVRHPLDRILSAYRDKMLRFRREGDPFVKLQRKIVKKYKDPRGVQLSPPSSSLSPDNNENDDRPADSPVPTFTQFLMKVLDDMQKIWSQEHKPINMHWRPFWYTCDPCALHFDLVAHVETLKRDQEYIIRKLGLQGTIFNMHTHASNFDSYNGTSDATKHYYSQVPLKLLKDIIRLYQPDFDLFGYSPDEYLDIVKEHDTGE